MSTHIILRFDVCVNKLPYARILLYPMLVHWMLPKHSGGEEGNKACSSALNLLNDLHGQTCLLNL